MSNRRHEQIIKAAADTVSQAAVISKITEEDRHLRLFCLAFDLVFDLSTFFSLFDLMLYDSLL